MKQHRESMTKRVAVGLILLLSTMVAVPIAGAVSASPGVLSVCAEIDGSTLCGTQAYITAEEHAADGAATNTAADVATPAAMAVWQSGPTGIIFAAEEAADSSVATSVSGTPSMAGDAQSIENAAIDAAYGLAIQKYDAAPMFDLESAAATCAFAAFSSIVLTDGETIAEPDTLIATCALAAAYSILGY